MSGHTPGPWSIEPSWAERGGSDVAITNRNHMGVYWDVCTVYSTEANARLISAAPDLLEALKIAVRQNSHDMQMTGDELRKCEDAIAKATGEQA